MRSWGKEDCGGDVGGGDYSAFVDGMSMSRRLLRRWIAFPGA